MSCILFSSLQRDRLFPQAHDFRSIFLHAESHRRIQPRCLLTSEPIRLLLYEIEVGLIRDETAVIMLVRRSVDFLLLLCSLAAISVNRSVSDSSLYRPIFVAGSVWQALLRYSPLYPSVVRYRHNRPSLQRLQGEREVLL